jgi:hypothetical protein
MCRHLVGLGGMYHHLENGQSVGEEKMVAYSAFVIDVLGTWCVATAGHNFGDEIFGGPAQGRIQFNNFLLADYFGPKPVLKQPIPFHFDPEAIAYLEKRELGLDFALLPLRDFYRRSLEANGIVPILRPNWANVHKFDFEHYAVIGLPSTLSEPTTQQGDRGEQIGLLVAPTLVWIDRLTKIPDTIDCPSQEWFFGKVGIEFSMKGMSGGPIFGLRKNDQGRLEYHTLAIQSRWYEDHGIIAGCPIPRFMELLEQSLRECAQPIARGEETDQEDDVSP